MDAKKLAELLRNGALKAVYHGDNGVRTLKELVRTYDCVVSDSTRVMNRLKAIFRGRAIVCAGKIFVEAEMVRAFIISGEYRQRFGP